MSWLSNLGAAIGGFFKGDGLKTALNVVSTASTVLGTGVGAYGAYKQAGAAKDAATANAQAYDQNAQAVEQNAQAAEQNRKFAEASAGDSLARGRDQERRARLATRIMVGAQRARLAGNNVRVDDGTPLAIQMDTRMLGELDVLTIRENARQEAEGFRNQGANFGSQADATRAQSRALQTQAAQTRKQGASISPFLAIAPTVLSGASSVAEKWLRRRDGYTGAAGYGV